MNAAILLGTLKRSNDPEFSHTRVLCEILSDELAHYDVKTEIIRLAEYAIPPGTRSRMGDGDAWPKIMRKLVRADIIIMATPIWWGGVSSLTQRAIERLDELNDEIVETGKSEFLNKVGGMVVTGGEDGAQHVIGCLANFMIWNGLTLPPACSLSYLGSYNVKRPKELKSEFLKRPYVVAMARTMARNLVHFATILKDKPVPVFEKNSQALRDL